MSFIDKIPKSILMRGVSLAISAGIVLTSTAAAAPTPAASSEPVETALPSSSPIVRKLPDFDFDPVLPPSAAATPVAQKQMSLALFASQQNLGIDLYVDKSLMTGVPAKITLECISLVELEDENNKTDNKASVVGTKTEYDLDETKGGIIIMSLLPGVYSVSVSCSDQNYIVPESQKITVKEKISYTVDKNVKAEKESSTTRAEDGTGAGGEKGGAAVVITIPTAIETPTATPAPTAEPTAAPTQAPAIPAAQESTVNGEITKTVYTISDAQCYSGATAGCQYMFYADGTQSPYYAVWNESHKFLIQATYDAAQMEALTQASSIVSSSAASAQAASSAAASVTSSPATDLPSAYALFDSASGTIVANSTFTLSQVSVGTGSYSGWVSDAAGKMYYDPVTGQKLINATVSIAGTVYTFDANGYVVTALAATAAPTATPTAAPTAAPSTASNTLCIDVSSHQNSIDWASVKAAGIQYAIIRVGYRGYSSGRLVSDACAAANIQSARANGIKVGLYVFDQSINETEAVEEASLAVRYASTYGCDLQIYIDSEWGNSSGSGRADSISTEQRTANLVAFCETVRSAGYSAGVYASASWFGSHIYFSSVSPYSIWVAHYTSASAPSFSAKWYLWQYTSKGSVPGISTSVDVNRFSN